LPEAGLDAQREEFGDVKLFEECGLQEEHV